MVLRSSNIVARANFALVVVCLCAILAIIVTHRKNPSRIVLGSSGTFTQLAPEKKALKGTRHKWATDLNDDMPGHKQDGESKNSATPGSGLRSSSSTEGSKRNKPTVFIDRKRPSHNWNALGEDMIRYFSLFFHAFHVHMC